MWAAPPGQQSCRCGDTAEGEDGGGEEEEGGAGEEEEEEGGAGEEEEEQGGAGARWKEGEDENVTLHFELFVDKDTFRLQ